MLQARDLAIKWATESEMSGNIATAARRRRAWRLGIALMVSLIFIGLADWYWHEATTASSDTRETQSHSPAITTETADYRMPSEAVAAPDVSSRSVFPMGAEAISGAEIVAALSDHTALLPGGFVEYYAPDGKLHGMAEEKHYGGSWMVRNGTFCTMLEGGDANVCSPVEREGATLYWSLDGEHEASPVSTLPGNPRNLQ
jgi:hypothetical protein